MKINELLTGHEFERSCYTGMSLNEQLVTEAFFGDTGAIGTIGTAALRALAMAGTVGVGTNLASAVITTGMLAGGLASGLGIIIGGTLAAVSYGLGLKIDDKIALKQWNSSMKRLDAIMKARDKLIEKLKKSPDDVKIQKEINALTKDMSKLGENLQRKSTTRVQLQDVLTGRMFANYASLITAFSPKEREVIENTLKLAAAGQLTGLKVVK